MTTPIFILSLPRSGSTLLQRLLLSSNECSSLGETSLLLRFLGDSNSVTRFANYRESNLELSFRDLRDHYPDFPKKYDEMVHSSMLSLYTFLAEDKKYFIDKTPRYTLIAEEIKRTFPNAKIIVLWRHPLAIASSISKTFFKGKWRFDDFLVDFYVGWDRLYSFSQKHADSICSIRYEDLLTTPNLELKKLEKFIGFPESSLSAEAELPTLIGRLGDPKRESENSKVDSSRGQAWQEDFSNWYRQKWARQFYTSARSAHLNELGYDAPKFIETTLIPHGLIDGIKEYRYHKKKVSKELRLTQEIFQREYISPYGISPELLESDEALEWDS